MVLDRPGTFDVFVLISVLFYNIGVYFFLWFCLATFFCLFSHILFTFFCFGFLTLLFCFVLFVIFKNIFFCVLQTNESHTNLERLVFITICPGENTAGLQRDAFHAMQNCSYAHSYAVMHFWKHVRLSRWVCNQRLLLRVSGVSRRAEHVSA